MNNTLSSIHFGVPRGGAERVGYHLSKANDESFYFVYDADPHLPLNRLRFCRKEDLNEKIRRQSSSSTCQWNSCRSSCLQVDLPSASDDLRFGLYACLPSDSLASIVYTQSFPTDGQ